MTVLTVSCINSRMKDSYILVVSATIPEEIRMKILFFWICKNFNVARLSKAKTRILSDA